MKFHGRSFFWAYLAVFFLFVSSLTLTGCVNNSTAYDPQAEYTKACADAAIVTPEKISKNLTAITPDNKDLIWENGAVGSRVLVVSWVDQNACNIYKCPDEGCQSGDTCKEGKECQYSRDTYVTVVPELKIFFKTTPLTSMRIAQLLGLPPSDAQNKACFLEMWVSPKDLFRPSPDPEITDHEAEIDFPGNQYANPFRKYDTSEMIFADQACDPRSVHVLQSMGTMRIYGLQELFPKTGRNTSIPPARPTLGPDSVTPMTGGMKQTIRG